MLEETHGNDSRDTTDFSASKQPKIRVNGVMANSPCPRTLAHQLRGGGISMGQHYKVVDSPGFGFLSIPMNWTRITTPLHPLGKK